jgi:hypothetical protein
MSLIHVPSPNLAKDPSNRRGRRFEQTVLDALDEESWTVIGYHEEIDGIEVDLTAIHPAIGHRHKFYIECKGGTIPHRSGLARTDTVKKAIGTAWGLRNSTTMKAGSYFLVSNMLPSIGSLAHRFLHEAVHEGLFSGVGSIGSLLSYGDLLGGDLPDGGMIRPVV